MNTEELRVVERERRKYFQKSSVHAASTKKRVVRVQYIRRHRRSSRASFGCWLRPRLQSKNRVNRVGLHTRLKDGQSRVIVSLRASPYSEKRRHVLVKGGWRIERPGRRRKQAFLVRASHNSNCPNKSNVVIYLSPVATCNTLEDFVKSFHLTLARATIHSKMIRLTRFPAVAKAGSSFVHTNLEV